MHLLLLPLIQLYIVIVARPAALLGLIPLAPVDGSDHRPSRSCRPDRCTTDTTPHIPGIMADTGTVSTQVDVVASHFFMAGPGDASQAERIVSSVSHVQVA